MGILIASEFRECWSAGRISTNTPRSRTTGHCFWATYRRCFHSIRNLAMVRKFIITMKVFCSFSIRCFYINLPIGAIVGVLLAFIYIPERGTKPAFRTVLSTAIESLDLIGFTIFAPASTMFLLALQYGGNQYAWNSATVIGLLCGAAAMFIIFLIWEYRKGDAAMIPFSMISQKILWSSSITMFFFLGALFCSNYYLPIYFQAVKNASPLMSGVDILPTILAQVLFAMTSGVLGESVSMTPCYRACNTYNANLCLQFKYWDTICPGFWLEAP